MDVVAASGSRLFARYAYPPNELGYCGADGPEDLLAAVSSTPGELQAELEQAEREIRGRARSFDGAWVYLEMLSEALGVADPLDARVVEAYWLGSSELGRCDPTWMLDRLLAFLAEQPGGQWAHGLSGLHGADPSCQPVHAFHVFRVYPWVGLLGRGGDVPVGILDVCRIRTGLVTRVVGDLARVETDRLTWDGRDLDVEPGHVVDARWRADGRSLRAGLAEGDLVTLHWEWLCDVVTPEQAEWVRRVERVQLDAVNAARAGAS